jgi:hypothetical protein
MGLDLWFREDVARILAATHETMAASLGATAPVDAEVTGAYRQGFGDALRAVAMAFGLTAPHLAASNGDNGRSRAMRIAQCQRTPDDWR